MLENSYDASNVIFYNALPEVRRVGESQVHCDHAVFVQHEVVERQSVVSLPIVVNRRILA